MKFAIGDEVRGLGYWKGQLPEGTHITGIPGKKENGHTYYIYSVSYNDYYIVEHELELFELDLEP